ncbi:MAG: hypothetical protein LBU76_09965, partial [Azoarcus sp.]|nr:hypothetical protein [Azoarcus sp.]
PPFAAESAWPVDKKHLEEDTKDLEAARNRLEVALNDFFAAKSSKEAARIGLCPARWGMARFDCCRCKLGWACEQSRQIWRPCLRAMLRKAAVVSQTALPGADGAAQGNGFQCTTSRRYF